METGQLLALLGVGLFVGIISSMVGIGGGTLVIPVLTAFFAFRHKLAVGTSLAMLLPPIGLFAVMKAYQAGNVSIPVAAMLALGFLLGGWIGGTIANAQWMPESVLRKLFAVFLVYVGVTMWISKAPAFSPATDMASESIPPEKQQR
ncbi:MAG: sulfite exporter TauE/SafE family protein [Tepidisphaeraceae bacterium]